MSSFGRLNFCPRAAKKLAMLSIDPTAPIAFDPGATRVVENLLAAGTRPFSVWSSSS